MLSKKQITDLSNEFETKTPQEILAWAINEFWPKIAMSSSFQMQSMPLLHMASLIRRDLNFGHYLGQKEAFELDNKVEQT